jgi:hypothetical protein
LVLQRAKKRFLIIHRPGVNAGVMMGKLGFALKKKQLMW